MQVPSSITAGDTFTFTVTSADYPASAWSMKLYLVGTQNQLLTSSASGSKHVFTETAANTGKYVAGHYEYSLVAVKGAEEHTIESAQLEILANLRTKKAGDGRTFNRRMLDLLRTAAEGRAPKEDVSMEIPTPFGNMTVERLSPMQMAASIQYYENKVDEEVEEASVKAGGTRSKLLVEFQNP